MVRVSYFRVEIIAHPKNPREAIRKLTETTEEFNKLARNKINIWRSQPHICKVSKSQNERRSYV